MTDTGQPDTANTVPTAATLDCKYPLDTAHNWSAEAVADSILAHTGYRSDSVGWHYWQYPLRTLDTAADQVDPDTLHWGTGYTQSVPSVTALYQLDRPHTVECHSQSGWYRVSTVYRWTGQMQHCKYPVDRPCTNYWLDWIGTGHWSTGCRW